MLAVASAPNHIVYPLLVAQAGTSSPQANAASHHHFQFSAPEGKADFLLSAGSGLRRSYQDPITRLIPDEEDDGRDATTTYHLGGGSVEELALDRPTREDQDY